MSAPRAPETVEPLVATLEFLRHHADGDADLLAVADLLEDIAAGKWSLIDARYEAARTAHGAT